MFLFCHAGLRRTLLSRKLILKLFICEDWEMTSKPMYDTTIAPVGFQSQVKVTFWCSIHFIKFNFLTNISRLDLFLWSFSSSFSCIISARIAGRSLGCGIIPISVKTLSVQLGQYDTNCNFKVLFWLYFKLIFSSMGRIDPGPLCLIKLDV